MGQLEPLRNLDSSGFFFLQRGSNGLSFSSLPNTINIFQNRFTRVDFFFVLIQVLGFVNRSFTSIKSISATRRNVIQSINKKARKMKVKKSTVNGDGFLSVSTSSSVSRTVPDASRLKHTVSSLCPVRPSVRRLPPSPGKRPSWQSGSL